VRACVRACVCVCVRVCVTFRQHRCSLKMSFSLDVCINACGGKECGRKNGEDKNGKNKRYRTLTHTHTCAWCTWCKNFHCGEALQDDQAYPGAWTYPLSRHGLGLQGFCGQNRLIWQELPPAPAHVHEASLVCVALWVRVFVLASMCLCVYWLGYGEKWRATSGPLRKDIWLIYIRTQTHMYTQIQTHTSPCHTHILLKRQSVLHTVKRKAVNSGKKKPQRALKRKRQGLGTRLCVGWVDT